MAKIQIDHDLTAGHYFVRQPGVTFMDGDGLGHAFGGDGSYEINAGITPTNAHGVPAIFGFDNDGDGHGDHMLRVYATVAIPGFGTIDKVTAGKPGAIGHLIDPTHGLKIVHAGYGQIVKGANVIGFLHGPSPHSPYQSDWWMSGDTALVTDHEHGLTVDDFRFAHVVDHPNGSHTGTLTTLELWAHSGNAFIHGLGDQHFTVHLSDDGRNPHFASVEITWRGHARDEVRHWVSDHTAPEDATPHVPHDAEGFWFY